MELTEQERKEKGKKGFIICLIIAVVVIIGILLSGSGNKKDTEISNEGLSLSLQKEIYYRLVELQDSIEFEDEKYAEKMEASYIVVAEHYNISEEKLREIVTKGVKGEWPMPVYD